MKDSFRITAVSVTLFLATISSLHAEEEQALSVQLSTGFIVSAEADNLDPDGSKKYITDLSSSADTEYTFLPVLLPTAEWDVGTPGDIVLFFNTKQPLIDTGGLVFNLGASYTSPLPAVFELDFFYTPFEEVWENPYVTGEARHTSDTSKLGAALAAGNVLGSNFSLSLAYLSDDVDEDVLAEIHPQLARDGSVYAARAEYTFKLSPRFELAPRLSIVEGDYDGESSSYFGYRMSLSGLYLTGKWMMTPELFYSYREYDETDPIFDKTRETDRYGFKLMANYRAPLGMQNWTATAIFGYSVGESNIEFYETESASLGLFLVYLF